MMKVAILSETQLKVTCTGDIQMGFYQQEKNSLLDYLRNFFGNRSLTIETEFIEIPKDDTQKGPVLSIKDQYLQMAEKYPMIKELKDRLGLELDY
jgi:DNA polymerase-3 subunit gamma/tau